MRYTLRQLEVFLAVARVESVSGATAELAMSQSAVSGALADLEQQFDMRLFDRVGKRLRLSELGRAVRPLAEASLDQARDLESAFAGHGELGHLRVGATLTIGDHLAVPLMAEFLRNNPGARMSLTVGNTEEIARLVVNFDIDVGLIEGEVQHEELDIRAWRNDELTVFCSEDHPDARRRAWSDADLRKASWIVRELGSGTRQTFDRAMKGIEPKVVLALQHTESIKQAVRAGLGLGCLSRLALEEDFPKGHLVACTVPQRDFRRRLFVLLHKRKFQTAALTRWLSLCERHSSTGVVAPVAQPVSRTGPKSRKRKGRAELPRLPRKRS